MLLSERTVWPYAYRRGGSPLVVSMPHAGTFIPHSVGAALADCAACRPDTDWHLPRLYEGLRELDATVIVACQSRYVIDANRPPDGANLYPGQDTPRLCPVDTFSSEPLYRRGEPDGAEIARRIDAVWKPYHRRLQRELARVRALHGVALLWDAHSIASQVPRLFPGTLPDLNFGTAGGTSCDAGLTRALAAAAARHPGYSAVFDGRFKGGYITRTYGDPRAGVHAVQLELSQRTYMQEGSPYSFDPERAGRLRPLLAELLETALAWARTRVNPTGPRCV
ncbi:MAG TPA: N-formylglutamate deformylase [Usitatibacter sp.]|nr:N-formylglutamate deformylase [Usitatibacter sp.]